MGMYQDVIASKHFLNQPGWHRTRAKGFLKAASQFSVPLDMDPVQRTDMVDGSSCMGELGDGQMKDLGMKR